MKIVDYFRQGFKLANRNLIILIISVFGLIPSLFNSLLERFSLGGNPILMLLEIIIYGLLIIFTIGYLGVPIAFLRDSLVNGKFEWANLQAYFRRFSWPIFTLLIAAALLYLILSLPFLALNLLPLGNSLLAPIMMFMPIIIVLEEVGLKEALGKFLKFISFSKKDFLFFYLIQAGYFLLFWIIQPRFPETIIFLRIISFYIGFIFLATGIVFYNDYLKEGV